MRAHLFCAVASAARALLLSIPSAALADEAKDALIVETILRLDDFDLGGSAKAQAAVGRYLETNWAGERYLDLIRRFALKTETPGVLRLALEKADAPIGADAAVLLVELGAGELLVKALGGEDATTAARAAKAISHAGDPALAAELEKVVGDGSRPAAVRSAALSAIYGTDPDKQAKLLAKVKAGQLADDLKQTASDLLMLSRDPKVREEAQSLFAASQGAYPAVSELVKRSGDAEHGKVLFATKTCSVCHQVGGVGINFGPGLSEIGDKLNKQALYQAIMEPSAAISMGFEGWELTLDDGTPLLGIVAETEEALTLTMIGGAQRKVLKSAVTSKKKLAESLMFPGLHRVMTPDELVDLVEYLSSLKKAQPGS
ncbi:MAG: c-type cytochrome [Verrucomicrobia bacterium]|nr:c-type cytochrome [Verrucomicrobiota bacterium]